MWFSSLSSIHRIASAAPFFSDGLGFENALGFGLSITEL